MFTISGIRCNQKTKSNREVRIKVVLFFAHFVDTCGAAESPRNCLGAAGGASGNWCSQGSSGPHGGSLAVCNRGRDLVAAEPWNSCRPLSWAREPSGNRLVDVGPVAKRYIIQSMWRVDNRRLEAAKSRPRESKIEL